MKFAFISAEKAGAVGRKRVARLMTSLGLESCRKRRFKATTDSKHALPVALGVRLFV